MAVYRPEFFPGDWVWDSAVRVSHDVVEANNTGGCGSWHEFGDITVHVVVNMVVVVGCQSTPRFSIEDSAVLRIGYRDCEFGAFGWGCWGCECERREVAMAQLGQKYLRHATIIVLIAVEHSQLAPKRKGLCYRRML